MNTASAASQRRVGRFELRRKLGEGAQAVVWLGFDARLEREVAVKLMRRADAADAAALNRWLDEARAVSRVQHPNIVNVFEADVHDGQPYIVFEYVAGRTLADAVRERGKFEPHAAATLIAEVADALQVAHAAGVVHRDLKPSSILIDAQGRARVMDFGIAARLQDPGRADAIAGTPGYMSPEATRGAAPAPAMDVFAAGVMLVELISGQRLVAERDPFRAMQHVADTDLTLPPGLPTAADEALRALMLRAIARDPAARIASAAALRDALRQWAVPKSDAAAGAGKGALDFLLRRMRHKSDFPALSDAVARIQRVASSEKENLSSLSNEILKDVALTQKLLRMVNSASYSHAGGGSISTVSRAVALIGFAGIRNLALSLVLVEHMHDKAHAEQLKEEFLRALMAGTIASELAPLARDGEEAFIGAMFQNLGRLLTDYYFPEEARQVRAAVASSGGATSEDTASVRALGLSFEELGVGVAKAWGLPDGLQRCMRQRDADPPTQMPAQNAERIRWITVAANRIADAMLRSDPETAAQRIAEVAARHASSLGLDAKRIEAASGAARGKLAELARAMNLSVAPSSPARRLLAEAAPAAAAAPPPDCLSTLALAPTVLEDKTLVEARVPAQPDNAAELLAAGVAEITGTMVESFKLNDVLRMIIETMFRALAFRRVVFCLRDPKTATLTGRFRLGDGVEAIAAAFKVPLAPSADLFHAVCAKAADTLIHDASAPAIASKLPAWYKASIDAPAFVLLPLAMKGATFALIYADKAEANSIRLGERELSLLKTLRNQALMAFKQAS
jgi:serine/threonine protein kinase